METKTTCSANSILNSDSQYLYAGVHYYAFVSSSQCLFSVNDTCVTCSNNKRITGTICLLG